MEKKAEYRQILFVLIALTVLTITEFIIAQTLENPTVPIFIGALIKAGLVVQFFMHIYRLWRSEEH